MSRSQILLLSGLGFIVALMCALAVGLALVKVAPPLLATPTPIPTATPRPDVGSDSGAVDVCKKFVGQTLLAPADADFPITPEVVRLNAQSWRVESWVDAPNRLGVHIRYPFTCEVQYLGAKKWRLETLDMQDP